MIRLAIALEADFADRPSVVDMIRYQSVSDLIHFYIEKGVAFEIEQPSTTIDSQLVPFSQAQLDYICKLEIIDNEEAQLVYTDTYNSQRSDLNVLSTIKLKNNEDVVKTTENWYKPFNTFLNEQIAKEEFKVFVSECFEHTLYGKRQFNYASKAKTYKR
ncbi:hypothetical protein AB832_01095 [Flavobacteriaceae bacterium (ex Bugula neritina AB1)]|nr:hypothetical protein AB832_01095 [Flavobacteriaceae bacterium (ex Bugula neritina AB1)]